MTGLDANAYADTVIRDRWMERVSLQAVAREAGVTVDELLTRVSAMGLRPRRPVAWDDLQRGPSTIG